jgi:hypothetical protein
MRHDSNSNAPASAPTSPSAPSAPASKTEAEKEKPATPMGESAFLTKQAADAKAAIARVSEELKNDLAKGVDPRAWMQVAPWTTLASAAVAGFLAAAATIPSKEQQALRRLRRMEKALDEHEYDRTHDDRGRRNGRDGKHPDAGKSSLLGSAVGSLMAAVQPVLVSVLTTAMGGRATTPPGTDPNAADGTIPPASQGSTGNGATQI